MHTSLTDHIVYKRHLIDDRTEVGNRFAQELSRLAVRFEFPDRLHPWPQTILKSFDMLAKIALLAVAFDQLGLEIKKIDVAGRAPHEHLNDALGLWLEMGNAKRERICAGRRFRERREQTFRA